MNSYKLLMPMLAAALLFAGGCANSQDPAADPKKPVAAVKGVVLETVKTVSRPETLEVVGTVRSRTSAMVSARVPGTVSVLKVNEGDRVRKGQLLVQLEAMENQAASAAAQAGVDDALRALEEANSRKKLAEATFGRFSKLFSEQAISRQEFDVKQTELELASQGVSRAEARLKQSREAARGVGVLADYGKVVAPISGIVTSRPVGLGATVFPAQPLMTIEDEGSYQLELAVPESMSAKAGPGSAVQITMDVPAVAFMARISEVVPASDPASRTFTAKVNINQKGVRSGMFGRGAIQLQSRVNEIQVPKNAIVVRGAMTSVWVADNDRAARMRLVKVGRESGDKVTILSGLTDGEQLVVSGAERLTEGVRVE